MTKKIVGLLLALILAFSLCACGTAETQLIKCARATSKVERFSIEPEADMEMNMTILGQEQNVTVHLSGDGDVVIKPFSMSMSLHSDSEELPIDTLLELVKTENGLKIRTSMDGGSTWTESEKTVDWSQSKFKFDAKTLMSIAKSAKELEALGVKAVRGSEATGYGYTVTGDMIADTMTDEIPIAGTDITVSPEIFRGGEGVKLSFWIDNKSNYITRVEADMSDMMSSVLSEFVKTYLMNILQEQMGDQMDMFDAFGIDLSEMLQIDIPTFKMSVEAFDYR